RENPQSRVSSVLPSNAIRLESRPAPAVQGESSRKLRQCVSRIRALKMSRHQIHDFTAVRVQFFQTNTIHTSQRIDRPGTGVGNFPERDIVKNHVCGYAMIARSAPAPIAQLIEQ